MVNLPEPLFISLLLLFFIGRLKLKKKGTNDLGPKERGVG